MPDNFHVISSPVGLLKLVANDDALIAISWEKNDPGRVSFNAAKENNHPVLCKAAAQLDEYFAGRRKAFSLALAFHGTEFQKKVWMALLTIPYGQTRSYAEIAAQIGQPKAVRAVGAANGKNPLCIMAPCHRVIGSNGGLTGFAGGMEAKALLLSLERGGMTQTSLF